MCFSVAAWDRIQPILLGLPFSLFWLMLWIILTPACMWAVYHRERRTSDPRDDADATGCPPPPSRPDQ